MKRQIIFFLTMVLFSPFVLGINWETIYNPFAGHFDYYSSSNMSGENVTAEEFIGKLNWTFLQNYPSACSSSTAITTLGDTIICTAFWLTSDTMFNRTYATIQLETSVKNNETQRVNDNSTQEAEILLRAYNITVTQITNDTHVKLDNINNSYPTLIDNNIFTGNNTFNEPVVGISPNVSNQLATKEYVDTALGGANFDFFLHDTESDIGLVMNITSRDSEEIVT